MVANLALTASGVGRGSYVLPGSSRVTYNCDCSCDCNDLYYYNLNILVIALREHTTSYQPTSTSIRHIFPILYHCNLHVQLLYPWYSDYIAVSSEQRILIILRSYYCSTAGGARAVHVSTAKFIQFIRPT